MIKHANAVKTSSEAKRLIEAGAIVLDDNKITDLTQRIQSNQYKIEVEPFDNGTNVNTNNEKYLTLMLCIIIIAIIMYKWMVVKH